MLMMSSLLFSSGVLRKLYADDAKLYWYVLFVQISQDVDELEYSRSRDALVAWLDEWQNCQQTT